MLKKIILCTLVIVSFLGCSNTNEKENLLKVNVPNRSVKTEYYNGILKYRNTNIKLEPFYISGYKVKQKEWNFLLPNRMAKGNEEAPVCIKSINDVREFCNKKSLAEGYIPVYDASGKINSLANGYRLPTQEELYYAYAYQENTSYSTGIVSTLSSTSSSIVISENIAESAGVSYSSDGIDTEDILEMQDKNKSIITFEDSYIETFNTIKNINQSAIKKRALKEGKFDLYTGLYKSIEEYRYIKDGGLDELYEGVTDTRIYSYFRIARNISYDNEPSYSLNNIEDKYSLLEDKKNGITIAYPVGWGITKFLNATLKTRNSEKRVDSTTTEFNGNLFYLPLYNGRGSIYKFGYYVYPYILKKEENIEIIADKLLKDIGSKNKFYNFFKTDNKYYFMLKKEEKNEEIFFVMRNNKLYEFSFTAYNKKTVFPEELKKTIIDKISIE